MKTTKLAGVALAVAFVSTAGHCAYPSLEEARTLFSAEAMNSADVHMDGAYNDFHSKLLQPASAEEQRAIESVLIGAITSIVVHVSTNAVDDSVGVEIAPDRGWYFYLLRDSLADFKTNATACIALAGYIGSIRRADFPSDLARMRGCVHSYFFTTNENGSVQLRPHEEHRQEVTRRRLDKKRKLQARVFAANENVSDYRSHILRLCGECVAGCRKTMADAEFAVFTNTVATVSNANIYERRNLFRRLCEESERSTRTRAAARDASKGN